MTPSEYNAQLDANYNQWRNGSITYAEFSAINGRIWDAIQSANVTAAVRKAIRTEERR